MNKDASEIEKKEAVAQFTYILNRIPLSLYNGNTNQIGRDAWNGLVEQIVKGVTRYVNKLNEDFKNPNPMSAHGGLVNPANHPRFLHTDLPEFVNTRVYNNNFHISVGIVTSSLDSHAVVHAHNAALGDAALDEKRGRRTDSYALAQKDMGTDAGSAHYAALGTLLTEERPRRNPTRGSQQKAQHLQAKELLKTLSSAMDKPYWDTCQKTATDPCLMPNIGRTPDITVAILPNNYTQNLAYPIFIGEILGKKEQPILTQRYAGYNATMQSLVFAPRAYYWEIKTTSPNLYILNRQPSHGRINTNMKTYNFHNPEHFKDMLDDFCDLFLDELINLRPLTHISSQCLRAKEYKDFLAKPPGLDAHIENQCWHLFVPKYNCQGINSLPDNFIVGIDHEDPELFHVPRYPSNHWPTVKEVVDLNSVLRVDQWNITDGAFGDLSGI